uniref:Cytochrome P450 n=1 Tax=Mycena chlorophos TaxID=658473 RepID=A0ABQ0LL37_MYCCL|nr:predicted protein [Mycena chlorophos]
MMSLPANLNPTVFLISLILVAGFISRRLRKPRHELPLPPGPKKSPIIGNLAPVVGVSPMESRLRYIIHVDAFGTSIMIVVLESINAVRELFDRHSSIYSDRIHAIWWAFSLGLITADSWYTREKWRAHRKMMHESFNINAAKQFQTQEVNASHALLCSLLMDPSDVMAHFRQ